MEGTSKRRAKGRARGRARGTTPVQPPGQLPEEAQAMAAAIQPSQPPPSRAHYRGAERPGGLQSRQIGPVEELSTGMAGMKVGDSSASGDGNGASLGRGVMRGKREIPQIVWTKPETVSNKAGMCGTAIRLVANYFGLQKKRDWLLCLYHVDFNPPNEDRTAERKKLLRQHQQFLGDGYLFDGMQLYLSRKLGNEVTNLSSKKEDTGELFQIKIRFIKELGPFDVQFMQVLNILLKRCQDHLGLKLLGRNYYNPNAEKREERYRITIWPGFSTSIRQFENSILLNVDVTHKFLRKECVRDALGKIMTTHRKWDTLLGTVVMTMYNEKTYRIDDIDFKCTPMSTFDYKGGMMTYMDYYRQRYRIEIKDRNQPMLMSKPKKRDIRRGMAGNIYLVPELCTMTGLTDDMRRDFTMMKDLAQYMRMGPDSRVAALKQFNLDLVGNDKVKKELNQWGLKMEQNLVEVQGRILPEEPIVQGGRGFSYQRKISDWSREMRNLRLNTPVDLVNWACVFPRKFMNDAKELVSTLQRVGQPMGMNISGPVMIALNGDSPQEYVNQLNSCAGKQMVLLLLPNDRGDRYGAIKKHLSVNMAIPSQCVLTRTLFKKQRLMSVGTKIAIQMNCKLGGDVWNLNIPLKSCMVIGYDAYHDSLKKSDSYGAIVSSLNQTWTRYYGQVAKHTNREELTDNFSVAVKRALEAHMEENKFLPSMVIVFRDGVGEGQVGYVLEHEVCAIQQCFTLVYGTRHPKFAFVIVSKRINTRLFATDDRRRFDNPPPGTIVDSVITLPERYDFYLVSQSVNQGTVSPTSFNVIKDLTDLKPDHMQRIAYKLTHLYYNWQGTVRVPAPCLYAHKLAFITGTAIHSLPHRNLANKLWYL